MLMVRDLSLSARGMQRVRTLAPMHAQACRIEDCFSAGNPAGVVLGLDIEIIVVHAPDLDNGDQRTLMGGSEPARRCGCAANHSRDGPRAPAAGQSACNA